MADLIDRRKLKKRISEEPTDGMYTEEILEAIDEQPAVDPFSRLRLKYGWHDATKILPSHSRHVLIWTNRGGVPGILRSCTRLLANHPGRAENHPLERAMRAGELACG